MLSSNDTEMRASRSRCSRKGTANLELSGPAAWSTTASWYLVSAEDRVIPPASQRFMAQRMHAHTSEIAVSHASLVSQPVAAAVIEQAARG